MIQAPDLFKYSDYRKYLSDWLAFVRYEKTANLSRLAEQLRVHTSYLAHVINGNKNLSLEHTAELSEYLNHTSIEKDYLIVLVNIERSGSKKLKSYWESKRLHILNERKKIQSHVGEHLELNLENKAIFYSSWLYVAIFVATAINDGQSLDEISHYFGIDRTRAEEVLSFLVKTNLCKFSKNKYSLGTSTVFIGNDSPLVIKHHTNWRFKAIQKMDTREQSELFYSCPLSLSFSDFDKIRQILSAAIEDSLLICKDSPAKEVACLNIDFFKLNPKK